MQMHCYQYTISNNALVSSLQAYCVSQVSGLSPKVPTLLVCWIIQPSNKHNTDYNLLDSNVDAAYWTAAECNVAIICACLPFLRPIISVIFPKLLSTNSYNRYTSNPRTNTRNITASRSQRQNTHNDLFSQNMDKDFDMYSINVKHGDRSSHSSFGGIEVTTEMSVMQESKAGETVSERRLVIESPPPS